MSSSVAYAVIKGWSNSLKQFTSGLDRFKLQGAIDDATAQHGPAGKTTLLRDVVGLLANTFNKHVDVVDTSNEIGGDGAVPHSCLGKARRMLVHDQSRQHEVLLQAVQNHNPQV